MPPDSKPSPLQTTELRRRVLLAGGFVMLLLVAFLVYRPGLSGSFLFDDFVNLDALGKYGPVDSWPVFWRYITSGTADPLGRPIALLSFLLDARNWPAAPYPFLRTNLIIHLLNGALLFALLRMLGRTVEGTVAQKDFAALVGAGCWLLHPLFISTTLYVVQREAMLPAAFTLLGLIAYSMGRFRYADSEGRAGMARMFLGTAFATLLALLSKANGLLLPVLALVIELALFRTRLPSTPASLSRLRRMQLILLWLPAFVVLLYLLRPLQHWGATPGNRAWTIGQRILTEPRVLMDYLQLLFVPRSISTGLFNDGYTASRSLLSPWTTLPAITALAALAGWAFARRRQYPVAACAILFFLAGHALESTTVPLELYFEHRNYLPALLLFWPLGLAIARWKAPAAHRVALAAAVLVLLGATTFQRASLWGHPKELARIWALSNPQSNRAQTVAAISDMKAGGPHESLARLLPVWKANPLELQVAFNVVDARCRLGGIPDSEKRAVAVSLRNARRMDLMAHVWLAQLIDVAHAGRCGDLDLADARSWVAAALENPVVRGGRHRDQDFEPLLGMLAIHEDRPDDALVHFDRALKAYPGPDLAARQAILLASNGLYDQALAHLAFYRALGSPMPRTGFNMSRLHNQVLAWQGYWPRELGLLEQKIKDERKKESMP